MGDEKEIPEWSGRGFISGKGSKVIIGGGRGKKGGLNEVVKSGKEEGAVIRVEIMPHVMAERWG